MRYSRQELFDKIGKEGQELLGKSKVAVIGLGATGSSSAELLARAGIGELILIDRDIVELDNLQRQSLYNEEDIGNVKAEAIKNHLKKINSEVSIKALVMDLDYRNVDSLKADLILDCTDNIETRNLINEYCRKNKISWIYSGVIGSNGLILNVTGDYCFNCVFDNIKSELLGTCDTKGVLNTIVKVISGIQVNEALKILTKKAYSQELIYFNIWDNKLEKTKVKKSNKCKVCNGVYDYLDGKKGKDVVKMCGRGVYQIKGKKFDLTKLKLEGKLTKYCLINKDFTIFNDGRVFIKAESKENAKSLYSRFIGN